MYQDPEGTHFAKTDDIDAVTNTKVTVNGTDENYYKGKITSLNEEIIGLNNKIDALNDELAMVSEH